MLSFVSLFAVRALQYGKTLLMIAVGNGQANVVQALLDAGADRYAEVRMTPYSLMTIMRPCSPWGTVTPP